MSTWITHLTAFYKEKKRTNPNYKYKDAMKDARSTYVSTADHSPKSDCHQRKLTDCKKRTKCQVTKLGKRKSYCRTKRNAGPLTASNNSSSSSSGSQKSILSSIFGSTTNTNTNTPSITSKTRSTKSRSRRQRLKCQFKSRTACKKSKSCKNTVSGVVKSYCRKKSNSSNSKSNSKS